MTAIPYGRFAGALIGLNASLLGFRYYYNSPLSTQHGLPLVNNNGGRAQAEQIWAAETGVKYSDVLRRFREVDPSLTNPKTSLKELIIPDEERQGGGPVYMLSKSPGKGMGLFATEFIPAGTKILEEKPVLTCPANGRRLSSNDLQEFVGQFFGLSPSLQKAVSNLQGEQVSRWSPQMTFYQELLTTEVMHPSGSRLSSEQRSTLEHLLRIFYTNCAALYPDFAGPRRHIGDGLFLTFSRINHSCEANAVWDTCRRPGIMSIRAAKDIQPDEEITISYFPETNESVQKRREITKGWGFLCQCSKCGPLTH